MNISLIVIISVFMAMGGLTQFVTAHSSHWTLTVNAVNTIDGQNILFSVYGPFGEFLTQGIAGGAHNSQQASFSISGIAVGDGYKVCVQDTNFPDRGMNCQQYTHSAGDEFQTIEFPNFMTQAPQQQLQSPGTGPGCGSVCQADNRLQTNLALQNSANNILGMHP